MLSTREQFIKDCQVLWKYLAQTGIEHKWQAIGYLYKKGKISRNGYPHSCPLCEQFWNMDDDSNPCPNCPWPIPEKKPTGPWTKCSYESGTALFNRWVSTDGDGLKQVNRRKKLARGIYQLTKTFK